MSNTGIHAMNRPEVRDLFELEPRGEPGDRNFRVSVRNTDTGAMIANPDPLAALVFLANGLARWLDPRRAAESPAPAVAPAAPALPPSPAPAPPASAVRAPLAAAKAPRTAGRGR